jgi:hypothetical protein
MSEVPTTAPLTIVVSTDLNGMWEVGWAGEFLSHGIFYFTDAGLTSNPIDNYGNLISIDGLVTMFHYAFENVLNIDVDEGGLYGILFTINYICNASRATSTFKSYAEVNRLSDLFFDNFCFCEMKLEFPAALAILTSNSHTGIVIDVTGSKCAYIVPIFDGYVATDATYQIIKGEDDDVYTYCDKLSEEVFKSISQVLKYSHMSTYIPELMNNIVIVGALKNTDMMAIKYGAIPFDYVEDAILKYHFTSVEMSFGQGNTWQGGSYFTTTSNYSPVSVMDYKTNGVTMVSESIKGFLLAELCQKLPVKRISIKKFKEEFEEYFPGQVYPEEIPTTNPQSTGSSSKKQTPDTPSKDSGSKKGGGSSKSKSKSPRTENNPTGIEEYRKIYNRYNWMPDDERKSCLRCDSTFDFFNRRHHCRECGLVLCSECCPFSFFGDRECHDCSSKS